MKKVLIYTSAILVILVVAAGLVWFGVWLGNRTLPATYNMMHGWYDNDGSGQTWGPGMMQNQRGYPRGMMGGYGYNQAAVTPLSLDEAKKAAESYLASLNNSDLKISEIMIFDNNAYVAVTEKSTGFGAFELLVDPVSKAISPEPGPNMMWNLKYGMMSGSGMMGGYGYGMMGTYSNNQATVSGDLTVTTKQAIQYAQDFLDANLKGAKAADDPIKFYGYYTLDYSVDGKVVGMLSVNGYNGQVFPHTWHGTFVEEKSY